MNWRISSQRCLVEISSLWHIITLQKRLRSKIFIKLFYQRILVWALSQLVNVWRFISFCGRFKVGFVVLKKLERWLSMNIGSWNCNFKVQVFCWWPYMLIQILMVIKEIMFAEVRSKSATFLHHRDRILEFVLSGLYLGQRHLSQNYILLHVFFHRSFRHRVWESRLRINLPKIAVVPMLRKFGVFEPVPKSCPFLRLNWILSFLKRVHVMVEVLLFLRWEKILL